MEKPLITDPESPMYKWDEMELDQEVIFPWKDVFECRLAQPVKLRNNICPLCNPKSNNPENYMIDEKTKMELPSNDIIAIDFKSPPWTWQNLCGQKGSLFICLKHKKQVDFFCTVMS